MSTRETIIVLAATAAIAYVVIWLFVFLRIQIGKLRDKLRGSGLSGDEAELMALAEEQNRKRWKEKSFGRRLLAWVSLPVSYFLMGRNMRHIAEKSQWCNCRLCREARAAGERLMEEREARSICDHRRTGV